jgi:anti-anti-sigma regulatory factor
VPVPPLPDPLPAGDRPSSERLTLTVDLTVGRITVAGDLDRRTVRHLLDAVRTLSFVPQVRWILDVEALTGYDDAGLRAVGACYRSALRQGGELTVAGAGIQLRTALNKLRLDHHVIGVGHRAVEDGAQRMYPLVKVPA